MSTWDYNRSASWARVAANESWADCRRARRDQPRPGTLPDGDDMSGGRQDDEVDAVARRGWRPRVSPTRGELVTKW